MKRRTLLYISLLLLTAVAYHSCRKVNDPPDNNNTQFSPCVTEGATSTFEVMTFNVETFPKSGFESVDKLSEIIKAANPDVVAFQEVASQADFTKLVNILDGYTGIFYPIDNSDWNLAYLVGEDITVSSQDTKIIFDSDFYSFPRPPFEIHVTHNPSGIESVIIDNHFKCCGGSDNLERRRTACEKLHNYISTTYPSTAVIILGDLNDELDDSYSENAFNAFLDDSQNWMFADIDIADGSPIWWSYPSWPSHIDHILVSDELFGNIDTTMVFKPDACYPEYSNVISDHRPVMLRLR